MKPGDVASPVQLHELSAGVGHVVHLQVCGSAKHPRDRARSQREPGGVHEVEQQRDAGRVQGVREGHGAEMLLAAAAAPAPLQQCTVGVERVEEPAEVGERERENLDVYEEQYEAVRFGLLHQPAGHEHGAVRAQLHAAHEQSGVGQDAATSEFVQVQQHVAGVASELLHVSHNRGLRRFVHPVNSQFIHNSNLGRVNGGGGIVSFVSADAFILK